MRHARILAFTCIVSGFAVAIAAIGRDTGASMSASAMASYVIGSLLIIKGYIILVIGSLPPRQGPKDAD